MWANIANFINENWIDILLVIVGASAFIVYWVQERTVRACTVRSLLIWRSFMS